MTKYISVYFIIWIFATAASCQSVPSEPVSSNIELKDVSVAPCIDQDSIFHEAILNFQHSISGNELKLDFVFTTACCQNIDVKLEQEFLFPKIELTLLKSGEICDCYCNYPIKTTLVIPDLKKVPAIELFINKKPVKIISTGH